MISLKAGDWTGAKFKEKYSHSRTYEQGQLIRMRHLTTGRRVPWQPLAWSDRGETSIFPQGPSCASDALRADVLNNHLYLRHGLCVDTVNLPLF